MEETTALVVSFDDVDVATANRFAADLADTLRHFAPAVETRRVRADPLSQDFGATLVIVLGSTAVTAIANGIQAWLARQDAGLTMKRTGAGGEVTEVTINGRASARTEEIVKAFLTQGEAGS